MEQEQGFKKHRHSIRLPGFDYSSEGSYFITLVTHDREHLFGSVIEGEMRLNEFGAIVREEWFKTKEYRTNVEIIEDEFVIMPNHFHGIVHIVETETQSDMGDDDQVVRAYSQSDHSGKTSEMYVREGKGSARRALTTGKYGHPIAGSLATIIGAFKSAVTKRINLLRNTPGEKVWLRNYYEHIIVSEKDYENIVNYIYLNPLNWDIKDEYGV